MVSCNSEIFSFLVLTIALEMSLPLMTPRADKVCLSQIALSSALLSKLATTPCFRKVLRTSDVSSESWPDWKGSLKRLGVGVSTVEGVTIPDVKRPLVLKLVDGVTKTSSSPAFEEVGHASSLPLLKSENRRLAGVTKESVFKALRGVSGGGMARVGEASSTSLSTSSSSLAGQS